MHPNTQHMSTLMLSSVFNKGNPGGEQGLDQGENGTDDHANPERILQGTGERRKSQIQVSGLTMQCHMTNSI